MTTESRDRLAISHEQNLKVEVKSRPVSNVVPFAGTFNYLQKARF